MKRNIDPINKFSKSSLLFAKRLQNNSTKKKLHNKCEKNFNNKISISIFNNYTNTSNSKPNLLKENKNYLNRPSSCITSNPINSKIFAVQKQNNRNSVNNINNKKMSVSQVPNTRKKSIRNSIINNQDQMTKVNKNNLFYSPSSPYTPSISSSISNQSNSNEIIENNNNYNRIIPSYFNPFILPPRKTESNNNLLNNKQIEPQEIFNRKMNILIDNAYKEIADLVKNLAKIDYNKRLEIEEMNYSYIKKMRELYDERERKMINLFDKYKYDLHNLKYRERKKYLQMYTNRTKELLEIDENFNLEKAQIKITYQNDYDSIKKREENEIKNLLDKKITLYRFKITGIFFLKILR